MAYTEFGNIGRVTGRHANIGLARAHVQDGRVRLRSSDVSSHTRQLNKYNKIIGLKESNGCREFHDQLAVYCAYLE